MIVRFGVRQSRGRARLAMLALHFCWGAMFVAGACLLARAQGVRESSLADAMRTVAPLRDVIIAVGADKVRLNKGAAMPTPGLPLSQIVADFGYTTRRFGSVVAVAPQNRVVLTNDLGQADIYKDIPPREAFIILAASLNDTQRQAMLGERGLGLDELTTPMQRGLFLTLFPTQHLRIQPRATPGQPPPGPDQIRDISNPMQNARLRVGASLGMVAYTVGEGTPGLTPVFGNDKGPRIYDVADQKHLFSADTVDGVRVRWTEANVLKKGQLDFELPALQQRIPLNELKTVGELIARISAQTKLELYADKRYEGRSLTILNASETASAADLLRSLCLCLTGAFRRVGPAYVLTDDVVGVGARRQKIQDFQADADAQRQGVLQQAEDYLNSSGVLWKTRPSGFGDPLLPTEEQEKKEDKNILGAGAIATIKLNFDQLTPVQQQALQQYSTDTIKHSEEHPENGRYPGVDLIRPIDLIVHPSVQLLFSGLDGAVDTDLGQFVAESFHDMTKFRRPRNRTPRPVQPDVTTEPPISELGALIPHRALLANARTPDELDNTVAKMIHMGLNELWLPVFCNGIAVVPGTPFSSHDEGATDLLAYAIKITKGRDIAVYPVLDLLTWGKSAPPGNADLTIVGETSAQDAMRRRERSALHAAAYGDPPPPPASRRLVVSPVAPPVSRDLSALMKTIAERPGIAGLVWRETCPAGYDLPETIQHIEPNGRLGHTEVARLAFLRRSHADPIDITARRGFGELFERADASLPLFDDYGMDQALDHDWRKQCTEANVGLLNSLYGVAAGSHTTGNNAMPPVIFVRERRDNFGTTWYGVWAGPSTPLPTNHMSFEDGGSGADLKPAESSEEQAKSQSHLNLVRLPTGKTLEEAVLKQQWSGVFKDLKQKKNWDGFVFEMESIAP